MDAMTASLFYNNRVNLLANHHQGRSISRFFSIYE